VPSLAHERSKPDGQRLHEFSAAGRASLELSLFSPKPIYAELKTLTLADSQITWRANSEPAIHWCAKRWPASRRATGRWD